MTWYLKPEYISFFQYTTIVDDVIVLKEKGVISDRHYKIFCVNGKYGIQV